MDTRRKREKRDRAKTVKPTGLFAGAEILSLAKSKIVLKVPENKMELILRHRDKERKVQ